MAELPPIDLADFPIVAPNAGAADDPPHVVRSTAICRAVGEALKLPPGVVMDSSAGGASLGLASASKTDPIAFRIRINGTDFGRGSKKMKEYLSISVVCVAAGDEIVGWTEDVRKLGGTAKGWADFHAGKYPGLTSPPPTKGDPKEFATLSFVDANEEPVAITPALRKLVAAHVKAPAAPVATKKKTARKRT